MPKKPGVRSLPKRHEQIATSLLMRIEDGQWKPGMWLPKRTTLAWDYQVHQPVMSRALVLLAQRGVIREVPGRGYVVAGGPLTSIDLLVSPDHRRLAVLTDLGGCPTWYVVEVDHSVVDDEPLDRMMGPVSDEDVAGWEPYPLKLKGQVAPL